MLATQCLLVGLGLGAPSSSSTLAIAATLNWVLKDGLGQLGGILFVARFGGNFDKEAKRYRFLASLLMSLSSSLEMLIPAIPSLFLPVASLANVCKNIAWMALSATRAQIHRNFTRIDNMGDLTGKAASWNTAASLLGTGLGVLLSSVFLISASAATEIGPTDLVLRCCLLSVPLTAFYLWASYRCSAMAVSPRLTLQRLDLIMRSCLPSVMTSTGEADTSVLSQLSRYIINPTSASKKERFLYFPWDAHKLSLVVVNPDAALIPECLPHDQFKAAKEFLQRHGFLALPATYPASKINIWFAETETDAELVIGILTAYIAEAYFKDLPWMGRLGKAHEQAIVLADSLLTALESRGWNLCESLDLNQRPLVLSQDKID